MYGRHREVEHLGGEDECGYHPGQWRLTFLQCGPDTPQRGGQHPKADHPGCQRCSGIQETIWRMHNSSDSLTG